jgi:transposase
MPYLVTKIRIDCPFLDRRTKLLPCQKEMVVYYSNLGFSQRKIAAMFNVSRRLITFIVDPEKHKKNLEARADRGGSSSYYNKDKHREYTKKHRRDKHERLKKVA